MADVFISYSRHDLAFARRLAEGLEAAGKQVWVDLDDIMPSAPWMDEIKVAIAEAHAFVFVVSPSSAASSVCAEELARAQELNKRLVPVVARATPMGDVPVALTSLNFLEFTSEEEEPFRAALARLVAALDTDIDAVHMHTRLLARATEWEDSGHDRAHLLRGRQLTEAEKWMAGEGGRVPAPTPSQVSLVLASRRAAVRRQRGSLGAAVTVALGMVALALVAVLQWHAAVDQRAQAVSQADAAVSEGEDQIDPLSALDLALKGFESSPTDEAQTALRQAVRASVLRAYLPPSPRARKAAATAADGTGGQGQISVSPSGRYVAIANTSGGVEVWRWQAHQGAGSYAAPYQRPLPGAWQAVFAPDGSAVMVIAHGDLYRWAWASHAQPTVVSTGLGTAVLSANGRVLANNPAGAKFVVVRTAANGSERSRVQTGAVEDLALSPDGTLLATWAADGTGPVQLWSTSSGRHLADVGTAPQMYANRGQVRVAISPNDLRLAVVGPANNVLVYSIVDPGAAPQDLAMTAPPGASAEADGTYGAGSLAWSADSEQLAEGGFDEAVRLWTGNFASQTFLGPVRDGAGGIAFSPDGSHLMSADDLAATSVWQWGAGMFRTLSFAGSIAASALSPQGSMVAWAADSQSGYTVGLWDLKDYTSAVLTTAGGLSGVQLAFSPNGKWLAVASQNSVEVFDVASGRRLAFTPLSGDLVQVYDLRFSSSGQALAYFTAVGLADPQPATVYSWLWSAGPPVGRGGLGLSVYGNLAVDSVAGNGTVALIYNGNYLIWDGRSSGRPVVVRRHVAPVDDVTTAAYFDNGAKTLIVTGDMPDQKTQVVDLVDGSRTTVLSFYQMSGTLAVEPGTPLLAAATTTGDVLVWDGNVGDVPAVVPTSSPLSMPSVAGSNLLISNGNVLSVTSDGFCAPLAQLVALAKSLLVAPLGPAGALSYGA